MLDSTENHFLISQNYEKLISATDIFMFLRLSRSSVLHVTVKAA